MAKRASHWTLSLAGTFPPIPISTPRPTPLRLTFLLLPPSPSQPPLHPKSFTTTFPRSKKSKTLPEHIPQSNDPSSPNTPSVDALDFTAYDLAIANAHDRLRSETAKIRLSVTTSSGSGGAGAGAGASEAIENIRLAPSSKNKNNKQNKNNKRGPRISPRLVVSGDSPEMVLSDVASVVSRGRNILIMVSELGWVRAVTSALQTSPIPFLADNTNYTPQTVEGEPLHLSVTIPPVTREARDIAAGRVKQRGAEALFGLREARGACKKRFKELKQMRKAGPDELRKAEREMEKRNEEAGKVVGELVRVARKGCEGG